MRQERSEWTDIVRIPDDDNEDPPRVARMLSELALLDRCNLVFSTQYRSYRNGIYVAGRMF